MTYLDLDGSPITDPAVKQRIQDLAIPPAWRQVWICPDPRGHIQATGIDAAGRKQYLYHPQWRVKRDEAKFDHILEVARHLPTLRAQVDTDLDDHGLTRPRVLAAITRLLDMGTFRIGNDEYAARDDPSFGVTTLRPDHVRGKGGCVLLEFRAKGGIEQARQVSDAEVCAVLRELRRRRRHEERLFGYWAGRCWRDVHADDVNAYLRVAAGIAMTAKDFRTWHGTVLAATELATAGPQPSAAKRKRAVAAVMREVSDLLGNTPAVAKASYVDPRVVDLYHDGQVARISPTATRDEAEAAVLDLLSD